MGIVETIVLIAVLTLVCMAMIIAEVCTPSFGFFSLLALAAAAGAVYFCFQIGQVVGVAAILVGAVTLPVYIVAAVKIMPRTRFGNKLALGRDVEQPGGGTPEAADLSEFVGRETTAETTLRPAGAVRIDGRRVVAEAESGMIEKDARVRVIRAAGNYVVVRRVE
jgi:membrane-bound serine protease (ClpP class)